MVNNQAPNSGNFLDAFGKMRNILDKVTGAFKGIDNDHSYIHLGKLYSSFTKSTFAAGEVKYISLVTGPVKYVHYRNERVSPSADKVTIELFEGAIINDETGVPLPAVNHRRINPNVAESTLKNGVTVIDEGLLINQSFTGGGTGAGQSRSGEEVSDKNEYVLDQNSTYLIKITNGSTIENIIQVNPLWYEEEDG